MSIPFSQACENNKQAILDVLKGVFQSTDNVLEVGSGTGQHAVFMAPKLPHITWQTSDLIVNHSAINSWLARHPAANLLPPLALDFNQEWPIDTVDGIFTANTLHIVSWPLVQAFFSAVSRHLALGGTLCIYGPFNYEGQFTSQSNANFELWLKGRDSQSGIRDIEAIIELANSAGLTLQSDNTMPANNRLLVFVKG